MYTKKKRYYYGAKTLRSINYTLSKGSENQQLMMKARLQRLKADPDLLTPMKKMAEVEEVYQTLEKKHV